MNKTSKGASEESIRSKEHGNKTGKNFYCCLLTQERRLLVCETMRIFPLGETYRRRKREAKVGHEQCKKNKSESGEFRDDQRYE